MRAFYQCENLKQVNLPENLNNIEQSAFNGCDNLEQIGNIPNKLSTIKDYVFATTNLSNVILPESITEIGISAFTATKNLKTIYIPKNTIKIGANAFSGSTLEKIYYGGTEEDWNSINFVDNELKNAKKYYFSQNQPTVEGNYWHYVNNIITEW